MLRLCFCARMAFSRGSPHPDAVQTWMHSGLLSPPGLARPHSRRTAAPGNSLPMARCPVPQEERSMMPNLDSTTTTTEMLLSHRKLTGFQIGIFIFCAVIALVDGFDF